MKMPATKPLRRNVKALWFVLIVATATIAGMFVSWRLPSLNSFAQDHLIRSRGNLPEPDDIAIVAIDEASIKRLGQFPWKRELVAQLLNNISEAQPKAIALDILYSEPTDAHNDQALVDSVRKAGNVVLGEQLVRERSTPEIGRSQWLRALPELEAVSAGSGHVNVETESDGTARQILLKLADDEGEPRWALAVETIRVGESLNQNEVGQTNRFVRIGSHKIPYDSEENDLTIKKIGGDGGETVVAPVRMTIDYIGSSGSFAAQTYSFSDVLDGKISKERFRGKYVLIGATAATLGDRIADPFVHTEDLEGDQHGDLMPGVEILANSMNTILRGRFYRPVSDIADTALAALVAIAALLLIRLAEGRFEVAKQLGFLLGLGVLVYYSSYLAFSYLLIVPPLVPMFISFAVATPLGLLRRSLAASASFDDRIDEVLAARNRLLPRSHGSADKDGGEGAVESDESARNSRAWRIVPRGFEWKARTLSSISRDLIERAGFVDSALRSVEDGLIIADLAGQIIFANPSARQILSISERRLIGSSLFARIAEAENVEFDPSVTNDVNDLLARLLTDRQTIEREVTIGKSTPRRFVLKMRAVTDNGDGENEPIGVLVTLSDITHRRELEKTKNEVIALVTHELRTPLTAIQGMSEVLTEHEVPPESRRKMLTTINSEAKRLAQMINDYLDITRLEIGWQKTNFIRLSIERLIDHTLGILEPLANKRKIRINRQYSPNDTTIVADGDRLIRAITNIVANAIKYSPPDTLITVETISNGKVLEIRVTDEGSGISAEQLPNIFRKFYRVPQRIASDVSGTGLGLALAQEIAELHGGYIAVESELGRGSTFSIFLPLPLE
jgi:PAS domain S-box-containing protein